MKTIVVIPARLASTRLPRKLLLDLAGKPVLQRTYEQASAAKSVDAVYIATDSPEVADTCRSFTERVVMTSPDHSSGTDRIAEAAKEIEYKWIVNVQGDEPFIDPALIDSLVTTLETGSAGMVSAMTPLQSVEELQCPNVVKVVVGNRSQALYFSRASIPFARDGLCATTMPALPYYRHIGIYGFAREILREFVELPQGELEKIEKLEQLRALENGIGISMVCTEYTGEGIDTREDLERARFRLAGRK